MSLKDVCRLCLSIENLVWIFDKRIENSDNMKEVIFITTGVEIVEKDAISQKICSKCCHITLQMFRFRCNASKTDRELKAKCTELQNTIKPDIPLRTNVEIKEERVKEIPDAATNCTNEKSTSMGQISVHSSIDQVFKVYPEIKLPTNCYKYDISPFVMLEPQATVKQYLRKQRKRLKILTRKHQNPPINDILPEIPNNIGNVRQCSSKSATSEKMHLAKKKTTQISSYQPNVATKNVADFSNGDRSTIETTNASEPPSKMMKLDEPMPSNNLAVQDTQALMYIEEANQTLEPVTPTSSFSVKSVIGDIQPTTNTEKPNKLYVCKICNSIHNSRIDLKVHQRNKHITCHLCKRHLKSLLDRDMHLKHCANLKTMFAQSESQLSKVESDVKVQRQCPEIIKAVSTPEKNETNGEIKKSKNTALLPIVKQDVALLSATTKSDEKACEVVDISDDDSELSLLPTPLPRTSITVKSVLQPEKPAITNSLSTLPHNLSHSTSYVPNCTTSTTISLNMNSVDTCPQRKQMQDTINHVETATTATSLDTKETLQKSRKIGVIKPEIKLSSKHLTSNHIGSDIQVFKELLKGLEQKVANELPSDNTIHMDPEIKRCNFKSLKAKIQTHKIPIEIRSGDILSATYKRLSYTPKDAFRNHYWHDIQPIKFIAPPKSMPNLNQINASTSPAQEKCNADNSFLTCPPPLTPIGNILQSNMLPLKYSDQSFHSVPAKPATATATTNDVVSFRKPLPPYPSTPIQNSALSKSSSNILTNNVSSVFRTPLPYPPYKTAKVTNAASSQRGTCRTAMPTNTILNGLLSVSDTNFNPLSRNANNYPFNSIPKKNTQPTLNISYSVSSASTNSLNNSITNTGPYSELNNNGQIHLTVTPQPINKNIRNSVINYQFNLVSNPVAGRDPVYATPLIASTVTDVTAANQYKTVTATPKEFAGTAKQGTIRVRNMADLT